MYLVTRVPGIKHAINTVKDSASLWGVSGSLTFRELWFRHLQRLRSPRLQRHVLVVLKRQRDRCENLLVGAVFQIVRIRLQEHAASETRCANSAGMWLQGGRKINGYLLCLMIVILSQRAVVCWQAVRRKKHLPIGSTFARRRSVANL